MNQQVRLQFESMKTPSDKDFSLSLSRSHSLPDRYISDRFKAEKQQLKWPDLGTVMSRLEMFDRDHLSSSSNSSLGEQIVKQVERIKKKQRRNFKCLQSFEVHKPTPKPFHNLLDWSSEGLLAIGAGSDIQVSNLVHYSAIFQRGTNSKVISVDFQSEGLVLASGDTHSSIQIWDVFKELSVRSLCSFHNRQKLKKTFNGAPDNNVPIHSLSWKDMMLFSGSPQSICGHDLSCKNTVVTEFQRFINIPTQSLNVCENRVIAGYNNGFVVVWDIRNGKVLQEKKIGEEGNNFVRVCPWKLNNIVCGLNNKLMLLEDNMVLQHEVTTNDNVTGLCVNKNNREIIASTASSTSCATMFTQKLVQIHSLPEFKTPIVGMALNHDQTILCTLTSSKFGKTWNLSLPNHKPKGRDPDVVPSLCLR